MTKSTKFPRFIAFEGGEGAGKTSLIDAVASALRDKGFAVTCTREPGGSALGEQVRTLLLQKGSVAIGDRAELLLFLASRAQHVEELIKPALAAGQIVLCDRFNDSTVAYQGIARGLGVVEVEQLCHFATGGLSPDLVFVLDIDPIIGLQRVKKANDRNGTVDRIESEKLSFHALVREGFLSLAAQKPQQMQVIDASQAREAVFVDVWRRLVDGVDEVDRVD